MIVPRACTVLLLLTLLPTLFGCGGGSNNLQTNGPIISAPRRSHGLEFTVSSDKSVWTFSDHVTFKLTMKNITTQPITFSEIDCPFEDALIQQGNQTVWKYSHDIGCVANNMAPVIATINPGESKIVPIDWNQKDNNNRDASPGQYTVTAWLYLLTINGMATNAVQDQASFEAQDQVDFAPPPISFTLKSN
jgi:hypothetical protein